MILILTNIYFSFFLKKHATKKDIIFLKKMYE